jgi:hypothetical protein
MSSFPKPRHRWAALGALLALAATLALWVARGRPIPGVGAPSNTAAARHAPGRTSQNDTGGPVALDPFSSEQAMRAHGYTPEREVHVPGETAPATQPALEQPTPLRPPRKLAAP